MTIRDKQLQLVSSLEEGQRVRVTVGGSKFSVTLKEGIFKVRQRNGEIKFCQAIDEVRGHLGIN